MVMSAILLSLSISASGSLNIPDLPLFLANDVQANIFFALDDSGSMDWAVTKSNAALDTHPPFISFVGNPYFQNVLFYGNGGDLDFSPYHESKDIEHCVGYNIMAYDPSTIYTPWIGLDNTGNPYQDQSIGDALDDPYVSNGSRKNLLQADGWNAAAGYGEWVDGSNGNPADGVYQPGECPSSNAGFTTNWNFRASQFTDNRWVSVDSLSDTEQTNYANWYSYYRKREYVLKHAVSTLIDQSNQRMGLATLHNNNSVGTPVRDMTNSSSKSNLLQQLFRIESSGGTPLRRLLQNTGEYFDQNDNGNFLHAPLGFDDASPILPAQEGGECQQNFAVLFSDGFWNGNNPNPSVGNRDQDGPGEWDGGPHRDTFSNTLADIAMLYYEKDLSSILANNVPVITNIDENPAQHLVTYSVAFGLDGQLANSPPNHDHSTPPPPWPRPQSGTLTTIDDMRHAAFNSRGLYLSGQDPQGLIDSLNEALSDIGNRTGSASAVAATSQSIQTGTLLFQAFFDTQGWDGDLFAIEFEEGGIIGDTVWNASDLIPPENSRKIFTWTRQGPTREGRIFEWANLSPNQRNLVNNQNVVDYIRGDQSNEQNQGGGFRNRDKLLGDIIHSAPTAVTKDQSTPPYQILPGLEGNSFLPYLANVQQSREDMLYVGANDGMLHAFRVDNGIEEFAFVPNGTFNDLSSLADPDYTHKYYVDGLLEAADAFFDGNWHTVLVGAQGRGGRSIFGLDVTNPLGFDAEHVLWEFTHNQLGFMLGKPQIVRLNNGRWAAIVGNGYNSNRNRAQLFIIDIMDGSVIKRLNTQAGGNANMNGLSTPLVVDINGDLSYDYVYAGDLLGNLWKFDLSDASPDNWNVSHSRTPLYTARAPDDTRQPITSKPSIIRHPDGGYLILFGTGKYFEDGDDIVNDPIQINTFYGIWDQNTPVSSVRSRALPNSPSSAQPSNILQPQSIIEEDSELFGAEVQATRTISSNNVDYAIQKGWYLDLVSPANGPEGERVIGSPVVSITESNSPLVLFNSFIPSEGCESTGGRSILFALDPIQGSRTDHAVFDLNEDGEYDDEDGYENDDGSGEHLHDNGLVLDSTVAPVNLISSKDQTINHVITSELDGTIKVDNIDGAETSLGRQSWRQLR